MITLDIRWPLGLIFTVVGGILMLYAAVTGADSASGRMLNAGWGAVLLLFGGAMLGLAVRAKARGSR